MKIIGIDVGKKGAVVVQDLESKKYTVEDTVSFDNSMKDIYEYFEQLFFDLKDEKVAVIGEAFGQRVVVKKHSKFYGVIELVCELTGTELYYISDSKARASVLGQGNGRRKDLVHEKYKGETPDISDAMLFIQFFTDWVYNGE